MIHRRMPLLEVRMGCRLSLQACFNDALEDVAVANADPFHPKSRSPLEKLAHLEIIRFSVPGAGVGICKGLAVQC